MQTGIYNLHYSFYCLIYPKVTIHPLAFEYCHISPSIHNTGRKLWYKISFYFFSHFMSFLLHLIFACTDYFNRTRYVYNSCVDKVCQMFKKFQTLHRPPFKTLHRPSFSDTVLDSTVYFLSDQQNNTQN